MTLSDQPESDFTERLRALPPAPDDWVEAAKEIPRMRRQINEILPHLGELATDRAAETAELESAIEAAGFTPEPALVAELRRRLADT